MPDLLQDRVVVALGQLYDIEQEIGRGGMAVVYRALDLRLKRHVAIKVLPPDLAFRADVRTRFLREAEMAAQLSHPNIVPIYTVDEREGIVYISMALIEGETLAQRLAHEPCPPLDVVTRILHDVADALDYAHAHGVTHRDIKPDNILLEAHGGRPVVTDFGIARAAESDSRLTMTGVAVGTPAYMSPEQAMGEREIDGRSDIYSLGVAAYLMLAGRLPFQATNTAAMMVKHLNERPRPLHEIRHDLPRSLDAAIARALAKQPEDRWQRAGDFRDALVRQPESAPPPAGPWEHRRLRREEAPAVLERERSGSLPEPPQPPAPPWPPLPPPGLTRREMREFYRAQWRGERRPSAEASRESDRWREQPLELRIRGFRRRLISQGSVITMLAGINLLTSPHFPWFLFPAIGMGGGLIAQWSHLWSDGVGWRQIFRREPPPALPARDTQPAAEEELRRLLPADVIAGPHGAAVRRAAGDRAAILAIVASLAAPDRELLPEIVPTVDALLERAASLAQMLHHLDSDIAPGTLPQIEQRIAALQGEPEQAPDRERRLALLERQRLTLNDLAVRRERVAGQLESAGIALQNLRLDLLKLRSSGVQAAINDVSSATREARAVSKEIGHVLDAAAELRRI